MFEKVLEFGINVLSTRFVEVTRQEVTSFFKILVIILVVAIFQNLLVRLIIWIKKNKPKKSMSLAISSILLESLFFLALPTLVMLFVFLATMDTSVNIKDYSIVLILIYFFSSLSSAGIITLMSRNRFKRSKKKSKKKKLNQKSFNISLTSIQIIIYIIALELFPKEFKWFALMYVLNSLVINGIAFTISQVKTSIRKKEQNKHKNKRNKKRKKTRKKR